MSRIVYDAGALIAIDRRHSQTAVERHRKFLAQRHEILVPVAAAAQAVRNPAAQVRLMRALQGCAIVPFSSRDLLPVGRLLARSGSADVVGAVVAVTAAQAGAAVVTSDPNDIGALLAVLGVTVAVLPA
ncbi:MAG TPA: hypothetical protein VGI64_03595 [Streptosporangiaceae bacterium]